MSISGGAFRLNKKGQVICWTRVIEIPVAIASGVPKPPKTHAIGYAACFGVGHSANFYGKAPPMLSQGAELLAVIAVLEKLKAIGTKSVEFRTSSRCLYEAVTEFLPTLQESGFVGIPENCPPPMKDLLKRLDEASKGILVSYTLSLAMHQGFRENEEAISLARMGALQSDAFKWKESPWNA